jgi:hypothetical protein
MFESPLQRIGSKPSLIMAGAVCVLALPSAVLAFSARVDLGTLDAGEELGANQGAGKFAPGRADPRLALAIAARQHAQGPLFRFTPAGLATRPDRMVTVVVRYDSMAARAIVVKGLRNGANLAMNNSSTLRIAPAAYNLGLSRGFGSFSGSTGNFSLPGGDARRAAMPDLSAYARAEPAGEESRLAPHISLGEHERPGRAPRTLESAGEQSVDLGGAYRVTRNLAVTAGVRYSQDRDRLKSSSDLKSDSQAVFVGTQFKF